MIVPYCQSFQHIWDDDCTNAADFNGFVSPFLGSEAIFDGGLPLSRQESSTPSPRFFRSLGVLGGPEGLISLGWGCCGLRGRS